jgi:hypothetical protein
MMRLHSLFLLGLLTACLIVPTGLLAGTDDAATKAGAKPAKAAAPAKTDKPATAETPAKTPAAPPKKPQRTLSPALTSLRDLVRGALAMHQKLPLNTRENSPTEVTSYCLAFGCGSEVLHEAADGGSRVNGITCLCWGYPCAGYELLGLNQGHVAPRIGYGCQEHAGEFLAMLAMSRVQTNYPVRIGRLTRSVADVVDAEKRNCRDGDDLSLKLLGLSYYVDEPQWKNDLGETWSLERIIETELAEPVVTAPEGGLNRLMGLSYAVLRRMKREEPVNGEFRRAQTFVADFQKFALQQQNGDGSWGPYFLAGRGTSADPALQLRSTGRILEWLATSLPDKRLEDSRVMSAVEYLANLLGSQRYQAGTSSLSTREIVAAGHALHALALYDERVFEPADGAAKPATEKPATEKPAAETPTAAAHHAGELLE